jgi:hypothetical protein
MLFEAYDDDEPGDDRGFDDHENDTYSNVIK